KHSVGGSFYFFESDHWGQVVWAEHINGALSPRHKYYQYYGKKYVSSIYSQEYYEFTENWSGQLTAQIRYQKYDFVQEKMGAFEGYKYNVDWLFFSPRAGINYTLDKNLSFYANLSIASRTPSDAAIYDANDSDVFPSLEIESVSLSTSGDTIAYQFGAPTAKSERVYDFELGGEYRQTAYSFGFNLFWMEFKNEIIPYGGINESGIAFTTNAKRSVHAGVELTTSYKPHKDFTVSGNFAFNSNRIKDYTDTIDVYTNDWSSSRDSTIDFADKKIPAFPDYLGNIITDYNNDKLRAAFQLRFVGKQFMELFNIDSLAIEPYVFASFSLSYKLKNFAGLGNLVFVGRIDNLFDTKYETSGYGWSYGRDDQLGVAQLIHEAEYYVAAERNFFVQLKWELE
ncbi:MAG: TonB-dependent receptor domain-containing protein, partial [Candidatus Zixiibacteriota bacterium]